MMRRILVTSALPYANGHIHIGHLVEYLQTDIWVRFQKLRGRRCVYICADDTHGTAIMIRARQEDLGEEELIARMKRAHIDDFAGFDIEFDHYGSTNSQATREVCGQVWAALRKAGLIEQREVTQLYDAQAGTFLADRFVRGTCLKCNSPNQYGDSCDRCGAHYSPTDLIDPVSTLSNTKPEIRTADHLFVNIEKLHGFLDDWTQGGKHLQPEVANYLKGHFLCEPLRDWDVSRPAPYFGFEIPDSPGNYWYVWFDAPIGYIGSTVEWCRKHDERFDDWWRCPETEIHHFIGKDITYFHTLFWPAMLKAAGFSLPEKVHIHGFLTVGGEKMSKSKGTFIRASTYLDHLAPAYLRYYYASKLTARMDDIDLNFEEFAAKVNADMVGNIVNLASRTARFAEQTGLSAEYPDDDGLFDKAAADGQAIAEAYESGDFARAIRIIMVAGDRANQYVEQQAPWNLRKDPTKTDRLRDVCTVGLNLFRQLAIYLAPVLPRLARQTSELLGEKIESWDQSQKPLLGTPVGKFEHMMRRVDPRQVEAMVAAGAEPTEDDSPPESVPFDNDAPLLAEPLAETIGFDEFAKVDLRVARVLSAEDVPGAKKLLKLTLGLGGDNRREVFAGIKGVYKPEKLVGRLVICAANLAPRKMKFGTSEGMIVAAGGGGGEVYLLAPDHGAKPGQRVH
ncbi:MAG: methionine--tRNA ligase [Planctomycetes bacterium]|nr:methionine--tRNA ligase [Planctomycetota bacterium]MBU4397799.1 methionine--tRNA ligase [Planctomycetota bacterium]